MSRAFRESGLKADMSTPEGRAVVARFVERDFSKDPVLVTQADRNEVDINRIVARVMKGQAVPVFNSEPFFGDVSELGGLQEAFMKVQEAEDLFMQYPAEVRERFDNDPVKFVDFLEDPANLDEAVALGLVVKRPAPSAPPAPAGGPAPTPPASPEPGK